MTSHEKELPPTKLVSNQPGLVPQASGRLTAKQIVGGTIYASHFLDFVYVFLMHALSGEETLLSRQGYKREAASHGVKI
eukprot:10663965-Ditylum_brightwellii.AAC.1